MAKIAIGQNQNIVNSIYNLNANWMHKVSMSSLELFYSNFFKCMFDANPNHILAALGITINIPKTLKLIIVREFNLGKRNNSGKGKGEITDIMIGFENPINKDKPIPYIIIENKVKSYPKNEQLRGQQDALKNYLDNQLTSIRQNITNNKTCSDIAFFYGCTKNINIGNIIKNVCHEILLTYIPAHNDVFNGTGFKQLLYRDFNKNIVPSQFSNHSQYVKDYQDMVNNICVVLENLKDTKGNNVIDYTTPNIGLDNHPYYMADEFEALQAIDFQVVFCKYQASLLESYLRKRFTTGSTNPTYSNTVIPVRTEGMMNKNATTTFFLVLEGPPVRNQEILSIGVQVEGNQFRTMVVGTKIKKLVYNPPTKPNINNLPQCIRDLWSNFKANMGKGQSKCGYNGYEYDCIYNYYNITGNPTFDQLGQKIKGVLDYIVENENTFRTQFHNNQK